MIFIYNIFYIKMSNSELNKLINSEVINKFKDLFNCLNEDEQLNNYRIQDIQKIYSIGDIHADILVLLNLFEHFNLIKYEIINSDNLPTNYNYYDIKSNNIRNEKNNEINLETITENNNFILELRNRYYLDNFNNRIRDINKVIKVNILKNNFNNIENNSAFIFLGDICDAHYERMPNNDISCLSLLFIFKKLFDNLLKTRNIHLKIIIGNHDLNVILNDKNNNYKDIEDENYKLYSDKFDLRHNFIMANIDLFNLLVIINNNVLLSHTIIFKWHISEIMHILFDIPYKEVDTSKKSDMLDSSFGFDLDDDDDFDDNNKIDPFDRVDKVNTYKIMNALNVSELDILNLICKYIIHKTNTCSTYYENFINNNKENNILDIIKKLVFDRENEFSREQVAPVCNSNSYYNDDEKLNYNACNNKYYIIGHIPTRINSNSNFSDYNIKNNMDKSSSTSFNNFFIYHNDVALSTSFFTNNIKCYLLFDKINENNYNKSLIKFSTRNIIGDEYKNIYGDEVNDLINKSAIYN